MAFALRSSTCRKVSLKETVAKEGSLSSWKAPNRCVADVKSFGDPNVMAHGDPNCIVKWCKMQENDIEEWRSAKRNNQTGSSPHLPMSKIMPKKSRVSNPPNMQPQYCRNIYHQCPNKWSSIQTYEISVQIVRLPCFPSRIAYHVAQPSLFRPAPLATLWSWPFASPNLRPPGWKHEIMGS